MQCQFKSAAVRRLQFAAAELEVVGSVAEQVGDAALLKELGILTDRVRQCIDELTRGFVPRNGFLAPLSAPLARTIIPSRSVASSREQHQ